jgi:hypothetical protein
VSSAHSRRSVLPPEISESAMSPHLVSYTCGLVRRMSNNHGQANHQRGCRYVASFRALYEAGLYVALSRRGIERIEVSGAVHEPNHGHQRQRRHKTRVSLAR